METSLGLRDWMPENVIDGRLPKVQEPAVSPATSVTGRLGLVVPTRSTISVLLFPFPLTVTGPVKSAQTLDARVTVSAPPPALMTSEVLFWKVKDSKLLVVLTTCALPLPLS